MVNPVATEPGASSGMMSNAVRDAAEDEGDGRVLAGGELEWERLAGRERVAAFVEAVVGRDGGEVFARVQLDGDFERVTRDVYFLYDRLAAADRRDGDLQALGGGGDVALAAMLLLLRYLDFEAGGAFVLGLGDRCAGLRGGDATGGEAGAGSRAGGEGQRQRGGGESLL